MPEYELRETGEFVITDYHSSGPFSSFLPGIAGMEGIPMWVFYVNRGQCVCSMGIQDKQHPIMEFLPANWAYMLTSVQGFRTFLKFSDHPEISFYEPFQNHLRDSHVQRTQRMIIRPSSLTIEEVNDTLGVQFTVDYFTAPQASYAGLIRRLRIHNGNSHTLSLEGLDGLPLIIPYGVDNNSLKHMRRLIEAFVEVTNLDQGAPFFKGKVEPADRPDVLRITRGNFYVGFESGESGARLVTPIVDPARIFGSQSDHSYPLNFLTMSPEELSRGQLLGNRLPCAMGVFQTSIPAGETYTYNSIMGHARSPDELNRLVPEMTSGGYVEDKARTNRRIIGALTQSNLICSSEPRLDYYARQNFLDNALRGGFPVTLHGSTTSSTLHLYSRKHGDLERDYNDFRITPTPFSQGNGNFRDVNQNRRSDLFFNPDVRAENVEHFYNLIQLDGFNPLVIKEVRYAVSDAAGVLAILKRDLATDDAGLIGDFLQSPFTPGELLVYMRDRGMVVRESTETFIGDLLGSCRRIHETDYGEGFWTDHWTYNLDLLENYLAVYPEQHRSLLFETRRFSFFDNPHRVLPRDDKYVLWEGKAMQLGSVVLDEEKAALVDERVHDRHCVRTEFGRGLVYYTLLVNKILCLIVNKIASLDPEGVGVEMEAGKPNWYDALNGLPGLMGSSISETLEIKRNILFLRETFRHLEMQDEQWLICTELKEYFEGVHTLLKNRLSPMEFWDKAATIKERYRERTRLGISGEEETIGVVEVDEFITAALEKLEAGVEKAWDHESNLLSTYFSNEVTGYEEIEITGSDGGKEIKVNEKGLHCFRARGFRQIKLPLFLEGPVHYLRCNQDKEKSRLLIRSIRKSGLYDMTLRMYKVNASLEGEPMEIGRTRVFSPGWLENESIWLHMEYKYILELLRNGFHEEFYEEMKNVCVPFFNPATYGRNILENSSFIVSSANPDSSLHGNGFMARLSGATAEFIQMLMLMTVGAKPFRTDRNGELQVCFQPVLPQWLFTTQAQRMEIVSDSGTDVVEVPANSFSFMFLGEILVTYHNRKRADTFGENGVTPVSWSIEDEAGTRESIPGNHLGGEIAESVRDRKVKRIEIDLG